MFAAANNVNTARCQHLYLKRSILTLVDFLLFTFYFLLITWLVTKTPFFKKMAVPAFVLAALFAIKVAAGVYYGWFFTHMTNYQVQADTWRMYYESLVETAWLKTEPVAFVADLFSPRYQQTTDGILASSHSYWNDIKSVLVVKLMALCNLLSGGRYYVNVLFFEYLSFFGPVALCRLFLHYFPGKKWYLIVGAFLFPSTLLWCSGFHKEGLLLTSLAMAVWLVHCCFLQRGRLLPGILLIVFHLFIVFLLRNYLAFFFVVWCIPWLLAYRYPAHKWKLFLTTAVISVALFFVTGYVNGLPDLPKRLATRQQEFLKIGGESLVEARPLQPGLKGYATALPSAVVNGFFQPSFFNIRKASYLPAAAEIILFIILLVNAVVFTWKRKTRRFISVSSYPKGSSALLLFCCCFCMSVFLLTGYTIPYLGAIVRYKAVVWPFILLPLLVLLPGFRSNIKEKYMKANKSDRK